MEVYPNNISSLSAGADGRGPQVRRDGTQEGERGHNCGT